MPAQQLREGGKIYGICWEDRMSGDSKGGRQGLRRRGRPPGGHRTWGGEERGAGSAGRGGRLGGLTGPGGQSDGQWEPGPCGLLGRREFGLCSEGSRQRTTCNRGLTSRGPRVWRAGKGHGASGADTGPARRSPEALRVMPTPPSPGLQTSPPHPAQQRSTGHGPSAQQPPPPHPAGDGSPLQAANERLSSGSHVRFHLCVPVTQATAAGLSVSARRLSEPGSGHAMWRRGEFPLTGDSAGRN